MDLRDLAASFASAGPRPLEPGPPIPQRRSRPAPPGGLRRHRLGRSPAGLRPGCFCPTNSIAYGERPDFRTGHRIGLDSRPIHPLGSSAAAARRRRYFRPDSNCRRQPDPPGTPQAGRKGRYGRLATSPGRDQPADPSCLPHHPDGRFPPRHGAHHGGNRHRQGNCRAGPAPSRPQASISFGCSQLQRSARQPHGSRAVRTCPRRLHRSHPKPHWPLRTGSGRHPISR